MSRSEMAATIMAGLVSNPSIIQPCARAADMPPFKGSSHD